jgi:hypothetical protein
MKMANLSAAAAGLLAGTAAVSLGLVYLTMAGAPGRAIALNCAALLVGLAAFATVALPRWRLGRAGAFLLPALGGALLAAALFGVSGDGATRWIALGPLILQPSLILLPAMLVAFARAPDQSGAAGMALAAAALALQPDRAMAAVLVAGLAVLVFSRREPAVRLALAAAVAGLIGTLLRPDQLPAVPYVDGILFSAFSVHPLAGLAVVGGAALLPLPALAGGRGARLPALAFGAVWLAAVAAAALGNYPTPLVGYGGSAIVGYLLSVGVLAPAAATQGTRPPLFGRRRGSDADPLLSAGLS